MTQDTGGDTQQTMVAPSACMREPRWLLPALPCCGACMHAGHHHCCGTPHSGGHWRPLQRTRTIACRVDMSEVHAWRARRAFAEGVGRGESGINLAEAALQVAAEDDALVSHSTVPLPVQSFHSRISRIANGAHRGALEGLPGNASDDDRLQVAALPCPCIRVGACQCAPAPACP